MTPGTWQFYLLISLGPILGLLGGIFGTWCAWKRARNEAQRRTIIVSAVLIFLLASGITLLSIWLPAPGNALVWAAYIPMLGWMISRTNRRLAMEAEDLENGTIQRN